MNKSAVQLFVETEQLETFDNPTWWQLKGLMYTATGYGSKIPTSYMVKHENRLKRVYCIIYSNIGTLFIMSKGQRVVVRDYSI